MIDSTSRLSAALSHSYRIVRELGQGGMATVYLAEDLKHKRKVALKVLKPELSAVLGGERFLNEITVSLLAGTMPCAGSGSPSTAASSITRAWPNTTHSWMVCERMRNSRR